MNTTTQQLRAMGFDVRMWHADKAVPSLAPLIQITDSTGITFYMPESATLEQCLARYQQKLDDFKSAETMVKQNEL